jgi:cellulose biosynthesis protein BcsQ
MEHVVRYVPPENYSTTDQPALGELYLLPSSERTHQIPFMLQPDETFLFLQCMEDMGARYKLDVVIIDTSPTLSPFDTSVYLATDGFVYVTECERLSFDGIMTAIDHMERFARQRHRESRIVGIIPNKLRADTRNHRHNISKLAEAFPGLVWTPITLRILWSEATNVGELIYTYAPSGMEARDAWKMVDNTSKVLQAWQTEEKTS